MHPNCNSCTIAAESPNTQTPTQARAFEENEGARRRPRPFQLGTDGCPVQGGSSQAALASLWSSSAGQMPRQGGFVLGILGIVGILGIRAGARAPGFVFVPPGAHEPWASCGFGTWRLDIFDLILFSMPRSRAWTDQNIHRIFVSTFSQTGKCGSMRRKPSVSPRGHRPRSRQAESGTGSPRPGRSVRGKSSVSGATRT